MIVPDVFVCPHPLLRAMSPLGTCVACDLEHEHMRKEAPFVEEPDEHPLITGPAREIAIPDLLEMRRKYIAELPTLDDIEIERCRRSLAYFARKAWPEMMPGITLHWNWHLEEICRHVQCMLEEWIKKQRDPSYVMKAQNLIINCPPRSLKSTIVSICAPAWMWLRWPTWKSIFVSANPRVAIRDARACHALMVCDWYRAIKRGLAERHPEEKGEHCAACKGPCKGRDHYAWEIDTEHDADGNFANTAGGIRMAMGFTAIVVGLGGDAIFVDDPNDMKKVVSQPERERINDTWDLSLCNRINDYDSSIRVMIMQRGHEMDLTGHWVATMNPKRLVHIIQPLEFDPELVIRSPFGYKDPRTTLGEILHPARFSAETVEDLKKKPWTFSSQYNQSPVPDSGGMFDRTWWNFYHLFRADGDAFNPLPGCNVITSEDAPARPRGCDTKRAAKLLPAIDLVAVSVDATFGTIDDDASSRVGLLIVAIKGADRFVLDDRTHAMTFLQTCQAIRDIMKDFPIASLKIIEKKANGAAVIETLTSEVGGMVPIENNENHAIRWNAMIPSVHAGNWHLLEHAPWATQFVAEFAQAPKGTHDDRIDAASTLEKHLSCGGYVLPDW